MSTTHSPAPVPATALESGMTHREVLEAMSGLLLGMFVAILSSTVVTTALPEIIGALGGSQSSYTWVVTSTLLVGAVFGLGTVAGPLLGGVITNGLGWRWCFYVGVPFAVAAFVTLRARCTSPAATARSRSTSSAPG